MNSFRRSGHSTELLFPVALLSVFALCALIVLLQAADIYRSNTREAELFHQRYTPLSYISERVRSQETGFTVVELPEGRALSFVRTISDHDFRTLIYVRNGRLCELLVSETSVQTKDGIHLTLSVSPDAGTGIMDCRALAIEPLDHGLWSLTTEDEEGNTASLILSEGGASE